MYRSVPALAAAGTIRNSDRREIVNITDALVTADPLAGGLQFLLACGIAEGMNRGSMK
jgi:hypothetical protein